MASGWRLAKRLLVCRLIESDEVDAVSDDDGSFDQFAVCGELAQSFALTHRFEFLLVASLSIELAAGIEEFSYGETRLFKDGAQRFFTRRLFNNVDELMLDVVRLQPFDGLFAGAARWVVIDGDHRACIARGTC